MPIVRRPGAIIVTGSSGILGRLLVRTLHRRWTVIGIDRRPFQEAPKDVRMHRIDLRSRACEDVFRTNRVDAVVHLNIMHDPRGSVEEHQGFNVMGTQQILDCCRKYHVPKLVVLSTANVYGPHPRNPMYLKEDAPLMAGATDVTVQHLVEVDMMCNAFFWQEPEVETVVLRPVHICGTVKNAPSNYLRLSWVPKLLGFDPMMQIISEDDVVNAIVAALQPGARGVYNVTGPPATPLSAILKELGKPVREVPHFLVGPLMRGFASPAVRSFPTQQIDHIRYSCLVDGGRLRRELDFVAERSLRQILERFRE